MEAAREGILGVTPPFFGPQFLLSFPFGGGGGGEDCVLQNSQWPLILYVTDDDLELLMLLPSPPESRIFPVCVAEDQTQTSVHAGLPLY